MAGKATSEKKVLRVVVFKEGDVFVAQCLEHDISAQASDLKRLEMRILATIALEHEYSVRQNKQPFDGIEPAPKHFQEMWDKRSDFVSRPTANKIEQSVELAMCA